ncbi:hypothetical protein B0A55_08044 [Friedmanniomyces simplex]|uniref:Uncharacterized protein n=1 Tax=Friedmanniomyces simplex TaxID=329884 RepID=A0A4U0XED6_9PEZI|nr:hypothetical protein B0A55_08044 [Friedmanniomyces simplex]
MKNFGHNLGRRLGLFKSRRRQGRPAKLQDLQADIQEDLAGAITPSPVSETGVTSPAWTEQQDDGGVEIPTGPDPETDQIASPSQREADVEPDTIETPHDAQSDGALDILPEQEADALAPEELQTDEQADGPPEPVDESGVEMFSEERPESMSADQLTTYAGQQAIRDMMYAEYEGEDETDYIAGPSRIVYASDGIQAECGALLLTLDLSKKIQQAIRAQRIFLQVHRATKAEDAANRVFEGKLRRQIARHQRRIRTLEASEHDQADDAEDGAAGGSWRDDPDGVRNDNADEAENSKAHGEIGILRGELSNLHLLVENTNAKRQGFAGEIEYKVQMFREAQAEVNAYLEEAFVVASLLEPAVIEPEEAVEELDIDAEYQRICRMAQEDAENGFLEVAPLHRCDEDGVVPLQSPDEQAKSQLKDAYWQAQQELESAWAAFNRRTETRALEEQANEVAVARGEQPRDVTPLDFDLRCVVRNQELTHDIINAEEALAQTKEACLEAGVQLVENDQESGFADHASDGYRESSEAAWIASAQGDEKVLAWLDGLPDPDVPFVEREEVEEVEVERDESDGQSVSPSDSNSLGNGIAGGSRRRRIDKWREICGW